MAEIQTLVLGGGQQILRGLVRRVRTDRDRERILEHLADIVEGFRIVADALHEIRRIGDRRRRPEAERVAVRRSRGERAEADGAAGAVAVLHDDALTELLGQRGRDRAADQVHAAARSERNDHLDIAGGIFLRRRHAGHHQQGRRGGQHRSHHHFPPVFLDVSLRLSRLYPFSGRGLQARTPRTVEDKDMPRRIIDISIPLESDVASDPPVALPKIQYLRHHETIERIRGFFPGLQADDLPDSAGWALEKVEITTHNGTHLDAPWHYHPTMDHALGAPKPAMTIDQVPLDWCLQPGVKLDFRHFPSGYVVTAKDVEAELEAHRPHAEAAGDRAGQHRGRREIRATRLRRFRLRHGSRRHALSDRARRARHRHRWLELGCAVFLHRAALRAGPRRLDHLGRPQGRPRHRLLPYREAAQSRKPARGRIHGVVLPGQGEGRLGRLDPRGGDHWKSEGDYFPHTSSATSTQSRSFAHCSSSASTLPSSVEAKPHCGDRQS